MVGIEVGVVSGVMNLESSGVEAASWDNLHERFTIKMINHQEAYGLDGACTDLAEQIAQSYFLIASHASAILWFAISALISANIKLTREA